MSKVRINREDANRVLLTELLPYEVPMLFSNDAFYEIVKSGHFDYFVKKIKSIKQSKDYGIPFNFEVKKALLGSPRLLSVIHPLNQIEFIEFYKKYDSLIIHQCSKSIFSLRKVSKIAKYCYSPNLVFEEDEHKNHEVEVVPDVLDKETKYFKSYFTYEPIDIIWKFYDRRDYLRLEQKYNLLLECDVTKCFYNIYTHSITWAVKDKESAKRNAKAISFENRFDKLMQQANYNETNGIVVGPEVSRIFAEIILQQVDVNVLSFVEGKEGLKFGVDFEIRRYVDDYFIFANDENHIDIIFKTLQKELKEYKLYINESKTIRKVTPFITDQAVGKRELNNLLNSLYNNLIISTEEKNDDGKVVTKRKINDLRGPYYRLSKSFIHDFQCIVKRNNLTYDILSKDIVRFSKTTITKLLKDDKIDKEIDLFENFALIILDICFYAYSLNITSSTTFKLAQMIVLMCKFLRDKPECVRHNIYSKVTQDIDFSMTTFQRKAKKGETNIETLNLLIALKKLDESYLLSEKKIISLFSLSEDEGYRKLNYFHYITLLYYIENNTAYDEIKRKLLDSINEKFINEKDPFTKAEYTMLFFDLICCPYLTDEYKKKIAINSHYAKGVDAQSEVDKIAQHKTWFMNWDKDIDLERVLKKKEWAETY
jgi:hypothetical protein